MPSSTPAYTVVLGEPVLKALLDYKAALAAGTEAPGAELRNVLGARDLGRMGAEEFLGALLATKRPQIFAESTIRADGSDWTPRELSLLGDINIAMRAEVYDNGAWSPAARVFREHEPPLQAALLFTPGALLGGAMKQAPDAAEIAPGGKIDPEKYNALVERRLLPLFVEADAMAAREGKQAFVTVPGLGCGAFAGKFKGTMGAYLEDALREMLEKHGKALPHIAAVYFDPFDEGANRTEKIHGISFRARPTALNPGKPQLCAPQDYAENGEDLSACFLCKVVAWDHASWPGNDFFLGSRFTDDGVSAAASNSMEILTGVKGGYANGAYNPPEGYDTWDEVVKRNGLKLETRGNVVIVAADGRRQSLVQADPVKEPPARAAKPGK